MKSTALLLSGLALVSLAGVAHGADKTAADKIARIRDIAD